MASFIDLRSDTVTHPTEEMREAMARAEVGDDVLREDPTVNRLEEMAAARLGQEAALFVSSGTMGNLVALLTHTQRGDEVLVDPDAHICYYEVGGMAAVAGVIPNPVRSNKGVLDPADLEAALRPPDIHLPRPSLICLESSHNRAGGAVTPLAVHAAIRDLARRRELALHLDGARIFNAAIALGVEARQIAAGADSVMFCLSKGLSAPVGSLLCGSRAFVERARKHRKMLGGGMRQAGILAAAGIVALETMVDRLAEDHARARLLAEGLAALPGVELDLATVQTNIVMFSVRGLGLDTFGFLRELAARGVKASPRPPYHVRMVTHRHIGRADVEAALAAVRDVVEVRLKT